MLFLVCSLSAALRSRGGRILLTFAGTALALLAVPAFAARAGAAPAAPVSACIVVGSGVDNSVGVRPGVMGPRGVTPGALTPGALTPGVVGSGSSGCPPAPFFAG